MLPISLAGLAIDSDIRKAETLPGSAYSDPEIHALTRDRVFARSWQLVGDSDRVKVPGQVYPTLLLEGGLEEPLLLTRDTHDAVHCLSNVCTHRGALLCEGEGVQQVLRCRYHGRRFALDGRFLSMPEFEGVEGFPSAADSLPKVAFGRWHKFLFAALAPAFPFAELVAEMEERLSFLPLDEAVLDPSRSRDYLVKANWALYCDNFLEGFHLPYVHAGLAAAIDYGSYRTELFRWTNLQVGAASGGEEIFDLPAGHRDRGQKVAAYWFWLFPNIMFSVYPWGVSVNVVKPLAVDRTKVSFLHYTWDPEKLEASAGNNIDRVEREDEAVVEAVQRGVRGRLYRRGRYSPLRETGVHHFHRILVEFLRTE
ncbi:MAG: aromatic ring-hydroxylating dioxygenase subunit alpha [Thermoanaerobaculia bacterium]